MATFTLSELAQELGAGARGEDVWITGVAFVETAGPGDLVFVQDARWLTRAEQSRAAALIVPPALASTNKPCLVAEAPRLAFLRVLRLFEQSRPLEPGVHATAVVPSSCSVHPSARIGPLVVLGESCVIGPRAELHPHVCLGDDVHVGEDCVLHANVSVYRGTRLGHRVTVHSGTVLGSDGFGFETVEGEHLKVPHLGNVVVEDDVEIGANCCVDRAKTGSTRIGAGTKIDNLVQVGHNAQVGARCLLAGCSGLAGSSVLEDDVILAADAGVGPHVRMGRGAIALARAGVTTDVDPGQMVSGFPARPHRQQMKAQAVAYHLPALRQAVRELERKVSELESRLGASPGAWDA